ncbi:baseplate J/gp47 family protein [Bradyrhizobium sp. LjRoot220]|uniref:baseplate J/gp47 family protein n=1 Tax=Bradyrhizobium sp. LjRoot220 TaxID=3342284 RepID=UPI003ED08D12
MTNVPGLTFTDRGFVVPSEQAVLTGVQADIDAAFGGGVNPALNTPQGQLATSTTAVIGNVNDSVVNLFNQFDPAYASGRAQDALGRIYFIARKPALPTVVSAVCTGGQGVVIPVGALARAADGNIYTCTDGTGEEGIPAIGNVTLTFTCNVDGPIACPADSLTTIFRAIPGWDSINNPTDGVLGNEVESRAEFELRRTASIAKNARGSLPSVLGAVLDVTDVLDAYVTENVTSSPITVRGAAVAPKSLYVSAVGGTDLDVATAIWSKKAPGCAYNGNTTVTVTDNNSGYSPPLPTYDVQFERPASLPISFAVIIANSPQVPGNAAALIQTAIMSAFAGADGGTRARIGSTVYASRYYAAVAALGTWANIISILVGSTNVAQAAFTGTIAGTALTVSAVTGTIAAGQQVRDVNGAVLANTKIVSGAGLSWVVDISQTVGPIAMVAFRANQTFVDVDADQVPTINASDIVVTTT